MERVTQATVLYSLSASNRRNIADQRNPAVTALRVHQDPYCNCCLGKNFYKGGPFGTY